MAILFSQMKKMEIAIKIATFLLIVVGDIGEMAQTGLYFLMCNWRKLLVAMVFFDSLCHGCHRFEILTGTKP